MNRRFEPLHPIYKQKGYLYLFKNIILFFGTEGFLRKCQQKKDMAYGPLRVSLAPHGSLSRPLIFSPSMCSQSQ
jgi:hypothetical protein